MQEKLTIARPYALAAFGYAQENGDVSAWSDMLGALAGAVTHPELKDLIGHPKVSKADLAGLLDDILGALVNDKRKNFVEVLLDAERLEIAPEIAELFERHKAAAEGVVDVTVESAYEIEGAERDRIAAAVSAKVGKECELTVELNPDLLGGAVIRIGDSVIDISLRGRLRALEQQLG